MTGLIHFSTDASSNDTAAPPINLQEGMPANVVNDSMRGVMAAVACWHADVMGGLGATGAASGALSVSTSQEFKQANFNSAFSLAFQVDAANIGPVTLNVDGVGPAPLRRPGSIELAPGDLLPGVPYRVLFLPNLVSFIVLSPHIGRPGQVAPFASDAAVPSGWVPCDGRALSRASYAALLSFIGIGYGTPTADTFNIPDFRGRTLFGVDAGAGRLTGAGGLSGGLLSTGGSEAVALTQAQLASHTHGGSTAAAGGHDHGGVVSAAGQHAHGSATGNAGGHTHGATTVTAGAHQHSGTTNTGGNHGHPIPYAVSTAGSGTTNRVLTDINPNGALNAGGATQAAGDHTHDFTTASAGDHSHGVTVAAVGDHAHGISSDGNHTHPITAVGDHAHGLTISATGDGAAHPNMPPGAIVVWAIKA